MRRTLPFAINPYHQQTLLIFEVLQKIESRLGGAPLLASFLGVDQHHVVRPLAIEEPKFLSPLTSLPPPTP